MSYLMAGEEEEEEGALAARASCFADFPRSEIVGRGRPRWTADCNSAAVEAAERVKFAVAVRYSRQACVRVTNTEEEDVLIHSSSSFSMAPPF